MPPGSRPPAEAGASLGPNPPCPLLPAIARLHDFTLTRRHGSDKGPAFYLDALRYAQSQWISGKPAQAILQLDKAWMADLSNPDTASGLLAANPSPYAALVWILRAGADGSRGYLGNPVRHFQHLASRMAGPRAESRSWRAWFCMHLSARATPTADFPRDGQQLTREGIWTPAESRALAALHHHGWPDEVETARHALATASRHALPIHA